ncbi:MAG: hypothetical protein ABJL44_19030 [Algibacter sp.]
MKKGVILLFIIFISISGFCQKKFSTEILTGFGFNRDLFLANQEIEAHDIFTTQINANYKFKLYKRFFAETGVGAQWYFTSGSAAFSNFKATSLRLNIPFVIGYPILKKISVAGGAVISNNRDFNDFGYRANDIARTSLMLKGSYAFRKNLDILLIIKQNVSNIPDFYLVNHPNTDISLGVSYKLF